MFLRKHSLWLVLILLCTLALPLGPVQAQNDPVERIDAAMRHLGEYLGGRTITRQSHFWQWRQNVYPDASLGCPVPGQTYSPEQIRAYSITITVDDVDYNYRTTSDGSVLILCINGQPHPSSIGIDVPGGAGGPVGNPPQDVTLPTSAWWVLVYVRDSETLHWVNANGEQASLARPVLPNEASDSYATLQVSRNGRYLLVAATLNNGRQGLGIYDFEPGQFVAVHQAQQGESITLGGRYSSNISSTRAAVGFTVPDWEGPRSWRVIVFDLTTGASIDELRSDGPEINSFVGGEFFTDGVYAPHVVYYDTDEALGDSAIHIQFVAFGEPPLDVPALEWHPGGVPNLGQELLSGPFNRLGADYLSTSDEAVFIYHDPNSPDLAGVGFFTNYNGIARGTPMAIGGYPGPTPLLVNGTRYYTSARWAGNGSQIVFRSGDAQLNESWFAMRMGGGPIPIADAVDIMGIPAGYVYITNQGTLVHGSAAPDFPGPQTVFQSPSGVLEIVWGSTPGAPFGLSSVQAGGGGTTTVGGPDQVAPSTDVLCAGAPPSRVEVGNVARVTFTDGQPLNVRNTPGGSRVGQMPEGTDFVIIGGPQCQGGYTWWQIQRTGVGAITGWVAEGDSDGYYIEVFLGSGAP